MEERSHNQEDMHDADSLVSGLSSLEDDAEDEFDKLMIRNERDQRRLSQATGGRPQAFTKARTHPRVGLTLDNLERNNATAESSANDKSDRRRSSSGSTKSDPAIHAPASWGRKSRTSRTWMRTITHEEEEQQQQTPVAADDDDYDDANVPRRSFEDSPLSHKSMHGTPRNDEDDEWDLTFELNEASMIASTPYIPRSTVLDDIRQREVESSKEQAAAAARLHRIREGSPEQKHRRRPSSTRTTENANSGAAKPEPAVQQPSPPQKRLRSRTQSWQSIGKSQPVTGMGREDMPPVMYKSAESIATVDREVVATAQRIPPKRIPHRRQDSQDLLRRLARASNTPSPARPQTTPPEPRNSPSETIPSETLKKDGKENAIEEAPVPDAVPDPAAPAEVHTEQKESQEASHGDEQPPKQSTETRVETDDVDATPMPVERPVLNPKTPVVTGAWVDTPGPRTVQRPATTETSRSRSQSPKKSSLRKEKSPERPQAPSEEDAPVSTALEVVRPQLPRSALQALVEGAKNQDRRSSADFGDSTINSLEDLITPLTEIAMDEDTLQGLQIPTATPRNDAERQRQQELLHLHRMNDRLRAARTSIRDASRGMKRVEDQVEHVEEGENGEMIKVINRSCPCATKGHAQSFSMLRWWKSLFWEQRLKTLRQTSNSRGKIWGGLTGLSIFLILFFTWWISEEIAW